MIKKLGLTILALIAGLFATGLVAANITAIKAATPFILIGLASAVALAAKSATIIPTAHYGAVLRFKERTRRTVDEGLNFKIPFIETITTYSYELQPTDVNVNVFSSDNLEIIIKGSLQWRVSRALLMTFVEIPDATILRGLVDAVKSEIGKIAGSKKGDIFIKERGVLRHIINCVLLNERMPHLHVNHSDELLVMGRSFSRWLETALSKISEQDCEDILKHGKNEIRKKLNSNWDLPREEDGELDVEAFYKGNAAKIQLILDLGKAVKEVSPIERRYGIDISVFELASVDFSPAIKKALEAARQAEAEMEASEKQKKKKIEIMDELMKDKKLTAKEASDDANILIGKAGQQVITLQGGGGGVFPIINTKGEK